MIYSMQRISILLGIAGLLGVLSYLPSTLGSPYVISDDRVRSIDVTPVLGRGYSIMTNSFQSTCLMVEQTTVPSYNYDYYFRDFSKSTTLEEDISKTSTDSYSAHRVRQFSMTNSNSVSKTKSTFRMITATMKLERYYASVREEVSPLSADAITLLSRQDYVGFFKACGPNYVRGIRRAQEVTAIFSFRSNSKKETEDFSKLIMGSGGFHSSSGTRTSSSVAQTLQINILGWGVGLGVKGAETFVAQSLAEFNQVMRFAFRSMTQGSDSHHIGMVHGIEIVPWVDNSSYQVASNVQDEVIEVPLPRSLLKKAILKKDQTGSFANDAVTREKFRCKDPGSQIDKLGYCCEDIAMYDYATSSYDLGVNETVIDPTTRICRPLRTLDTSIIKNNMASNGEFVARLDRAVRYKLDTMAVMEKCVSAARAFPPAQYDYMILKKQDQVKYDGVIEIELTLFELKLGIDPTNDYALLRHMGKELDEWMDMFYQPCMSALFGSSIGSNPETDPIYFMAYPWHTHSQCTKLSCFGNSMRWDRNTGRCTVSLVGGADAPDYTAASSSDQDKHCSKIVVDNGDTEQCKYTTAELNKFRTAARTCWTNTTSLTTASIDFYMRNYCLPQFTGDEVSATRKQEIQDAYVADRCDSTY